MKLKCPEQGRVQTNSPALSRPLTAASLTLRSMALAASLTVSAAVLRTNGVVENSLADRRKEVRSMIAFDIRRQNVLRTESNGGLSIEALRG